MRVLVFGSRSITDAAAVRKILNDMLDSGTFDACDMELISGGARGVDSIAEEWAIEREIPSEIHRPNYIDGGKASPLMRNKKMADLADFGVAIWDGKSRGTIHTISCLVRMGKRCMVLGVKGGY